jgi:2-C-methyl-D-erythritol 4-phosphate cytidylyltransferase
MNITLSVIILAAGKSVRFGSKTKKQFCVLNDNISVLEHSLKTFHKLRFVDKIIVVLPKKDLKKYEKKLSGLYPKTIFVSGGKERYNSVQNGLKKCFYNTTYVAIHDAARPLVSKRLILECVKWLKKYDVVIPGIKVNDTLKLVNSNLEVVKHIDRKNVFAIQTPQMFKTDVVYKIYSKKNVNKWLKKFLITDDSQLAQLGGYKVKVVIGEKSNLKITSKEDLDLVNFYLTQK